MGTALVMEHANALAQMIVSEKDKLFDERVEALVKLYRRAEFYLKQGFLESIVCEFHRKKVEMIMQAETKGEITEILKLSKPHFDGKKFVYTSPYAVEEEMEFHAMTGISTSASTSVHQSIPMCSALTPLQEK